MIEPLHIAVVGAGIAGLSCATALQHAGYRVSVFDKSRGPGGRMSTRRGDSWQCDHGARFFTADDPGFRAEVARWERAGVAAPWYPELRQIDAAGRVTRGDAAERFVGTPGMSAPARMLASSLALYSGQTVSAVQRDGTSWRLLGQGEALSGCRFDALVIALPAPQAAQLLHAVAPRQGALAASVTMAPCWALMLQYAQPQALGFDAAQLAAGALCWAARDSAKPGRSGSESWVLHASAAWSTAHIDADPVTVAAQLLPAFAELGAAAPVQWQAHRWLYATPATPRAEVFDWDPKLALGLCGDWLGGVNVEAAWLSGRRLAHEISLR
ncbi:NAD(P)/FAD-dependent oxidoreductase [Massilia sp. CF038]|uniref:NAD(P)/FAD-dependent oxidoreductase n=1 Tax=Massilia sp. CF038 TaxID=1881045 RepID=UPI000911F982|nr:FAD-dependent oxidoreductase [Massilia sp. CF038]SHG62855.1 hypothetical protein SAMN05428948_1349 [Massilia sp. CF038]